MAHLISLRQRIKAIETIKKITHAMRLISMSTHGQLKHRASFVAAYTQSVEELYLLTKKSITDETDLTTKPMRTLLVVIGSQKGLCGNFNINLHSFVQENSSFDTSDIIIVGKKIVEQNLFQEQHAVIKTITTLSPRSMLNIAQELAVDISSNISTYKNIYIIGTVAKTFFTQRPMSINLFEHSSSSTTQHHDEYYWPQETISLMPIILQQYLEAKIYYALFQSLMAEQAARFVSMDSSTRNAKKLLETTKLQYNKLRQATITKELTELSSSF